MLLKCLEFREMLLVSPRFKVLSQLDAEGAVKIFYAVFVTSSVQFAESTKGYWKWLPMFRQLQGRAERSSLQHSTQTVSSCVTFSTCMVVHSDAGWHCHGFKVCSQHVGKKPDGYLFFSAFFFSGLGSKQHL